MKIVRDKLTRRDRITYIPIDKLSPDDSQPRRRFDEAALCSLAASIKENGVLQPITVRKAGSKYRLIAGERRLRACYIAGITSVPCIVVDTDERTASVLTLLENLQRADLSFFEEAEGIAHLMRIGGYTQDDVAKKLGKSQSAISNKLRLLKLPRGIISRLCEHGLCERHARALLRLSSREEQEAALSHIISESLNVFEADEYIDSLLSARKRRSREAKPRSQYVIKDVRLFYNTIDRAIDTMRRSGVRADLSRDEDEKSICLNIRIFK